MHQKTVIELLALKLSGEASPADLALLGRLIDQYPDTIYHQEVLQQLFQNKKEDADLAYYYNRHRLKYQDKLIFTDHIIPSAPLIKKRRSLILVCSLLLISSITGYFFYRNRQATGEIYNMQVVSGNEVRKNLRLPDGTIVSLNAHSKLIYDKDMITRNVRSIKLIGEAYFDVAHDKRHPFIINTSKIAIKVLGTAFNVKAYPGDAQTEATLFRGAIELSVNSRKGKKVLLKPLDKFALLGDSLMKIEKVLPLKIEGQEYTQETSWINHNLVFVNETFGQLVPKLEKRFGVKMEIKNVKLQASHFTGAFTDETLAETLSAMQLIKHFKFKIKSYDVIIY